MDEIAKKKPVEKFRRNEKDSGSPEIQIAVLTERINELTEHLKSHVKDFSSRRGLTALVSKRRKLLDYLDRKNHERYQSLTKELNIRRTK